jgi:hypothetical protein
LEILELNEEEIRKYVKRQEKKDKEAECQGLLEV